VNDGVYIFGYLSLLSASSVAGSLKSSKDSFELNTTPVILDGYIRTWRSERDSADEIFKQYVTLENLEAIDRFSWATLRKDNQGWVNGLLFETSILQLKIMDAREVGYKRVEITGKVRAYDGFDFNKSNQIYTYIANEVFGEKLSYIDLNYINMGLAGAKEIDRVASGFFEDYIGSTEQCTSIVEKLYQIYMSYDGKILYMLNTKDSSVIQIHHFNNIRYIVRDVADAYANQDICEAWSDFDIRNAVSGQAGLYSEALLVVLDTDIKRLFDIGNQWIDLMLLRNENVPHELKICIIKRGSWVCDLIGLDLGIIEREQVRIWGNGFVLKNNQTI
jgi:hypothetical protein